MKLSILTLVALLTTSSLAAAQNGRTFFNDGSVENTYNSGQKISSPMDNIDNLAKNHVGRNIFGDGSVENNYVAGRQLPGIALSTQLSDDTGRNGFGDGSPLSN